MVPLLLLEDRRPTSPPELICNIPVRITTRPRRNVDNSMKINSRCLSRIPLVELTPTYQRGSLAKVPRICVSNVRSLAPKIDEVSEFLLRHQIDLAFITETWLKESIDDSVISISGYCVFRRDRETDCHGGVCIYVNTEQLNNFTVLEDLNCCEQHELLWLRIRPNRLPRGVPSIVVGILYYPPGGDDKLICDHLFQTLSSIESNYPNSGIILAGDFNRLNINRILKQLCLKQLVKVPTRNDAILDLVLTNLHDHYCSPESLPPFGLSDHNTLIVHPSNKTHTSNKKIIRMKRDHRSSRRAEFGRYLCSIDWSSINSDQNSCEEM